MYIFKHLWGKNKIVSQIKKSEEIKKFEFLKISVSNISNYVHIL